MKPEQQSTPPYFSKLIEKNIITETTEIDAVYRGKDIAGDLFVDAVGTFVILTIQKTTEVDYIFTCASTRDGHRRMIPASAVVMVDGMEPARLAETYGIALTGAAIPPGRRRGRKPKVRVETQD
jgi:hypothetical protein